MRKFLKGLIGPWLLLFVGAVFLQDFALGRAGVSQGTLPFWLDFAALLLAAEAGRMDAHSKTR